MSQSDGGQATPQPGGGFFVGDSSRQGFLFGSRGTVEGGCRYAQPEPPGGNGAFVAPQALGDLAVFGGAQQSVFLQAELMNLQMSGNDPELVTARLDRLDRALEAPFI